MDDAIKKVKKFYEIFDFSKIITNPPEQTQEFLDNEDKWIEKYPWSGKDILEIGCGYGRLTEKIAPLTKNIIGIDFSVPLVYESKKLLVGFPNTSLFIMDAARLGFAENVFDSVVCLNASFSNMPNIETIVIKEMKRVCKIGGEVIISVLSEKAENDQLEKYHQAGLHVISNQDNLIITKEGLHSKRFSKNDLHKLLLKIGGLKYEIKEFCSIGYLIIATK